MLENQRLPILRVLFSIIQYKSRLFGMGTLSDMLPSGDQLRTKPVPKLILA
jgi:hypothetical protein